MRLADKVLLASLNRHKFEEFQSLMAAFPQIKLVPPVELVRNPDALSRVESHDTYLENAIAKARLANHASHYPSLADDSGLEVDFLHGKPGVRSHRYAPPVAGISQDQANVQLLLSQMKSAPTRSARFVCALALIVEGVLLHSTGTLEGSIADAPRGSAGFGYDSVFVPNGSAKTLAEMSSSEKNAISHRAKALKELIIQIQNHGIVFAKP